MRFITMLIIHCSAVTTFQTSSVEQINAWHHARGWSNGCGYHYVVRRNGDIERGRPDEMIGAHCLNHNRHSIGICYEGGLNADGKPADTRTETQKINCAMYLALQFIHEATTYAESCGGGGGGNLSGWGRDKDEEDELWWRHCIAKSASMVRPAKHSKKRKR